MTTGRGRPPSSPADPSFPRLTFTHPHFNNSRRFSPFSLSLSLSLSLPLRAARSSPIGMEARAASTYNIHLYLHRARQEDGRRGARGARRSIGTLLAAFPDPPHRRYQDCRRTDQCRERRRRLGVHRRLLGRTAGRPAGRTRTDPRKSPDGFAGPRLLPEEPLSARASFGSFGSIVGTD